VSNVTRNDKALIKHVMLHGRKSESEAIAYLDRYCGNWRGTPKPKARRIKSISTPEPQD